MALLLSGAEAPRRPSTPRIGLDDHRAAYRHLWAADSTIRTLINRIGPCDLVPRRSAFAILCHSIISQQLSIAAATTIFDRLVNLYPTRRLTPIAILASTTPSLRAAGLSQRKIRHVQDLALAFQDRRVESRRFSAQSNEETIAALTRIKGIGRWTAEMFLIFSLNRPDVLPVDDLGIRRIGPTMVSIVCASQRRNSETNRRAVASL
jgi:DNA-3-methyladenine glycosylase II